MKNERGRGKRKTLFLVALTHILPFSKPGRRDHDISRPSSSFFRRAWSHDKNLSWPYCSTYPIHGRGGTWTKFPVPIFSTEANRRAKTHSSFPFSLVSLAFMLPSLVSLVFMLFYLLLLPFSCPHTLSVSVQRVVPAQGGAGQALRQSTAHHGHDVKAWLRSCAMFNDSMSVPLKSFWKRFLNFTCSAWCVREAWADEKLR